MPSRSDCRTVSGVPGVLEILIDSVHIPKGGVDALIRGPPAVLRQRGGQHTFDQMIQHRDQVGTRFGQLFRNEEKPDKSQQ